MKLTFHGAAGEVTGSNYLLELGHHKILIDCGLHQGGNFAEKQNFEPFPYDPKDIQAVLVTHAHLDHTGRLPKLVQEGFKGTIYSTPPTRDFAEYILLDSEQILCREAEREGHPGICSLESIKTVRRQWEGVRYHEPFHVGPFRVEFFDAGHILGAAIIKIVADGKTIVFSGDLGNYPAPIIGVTEKMDSADYCVVDSTYGGRVHLNVDKRREELEDAVEDTVKRGGVLLIPAFAMERTQELLYHLNELVEGGRIPRVPVYVDSPLAIRLTEVYKKYENYFNKETQALAATGEDILNFPGLHLTLTTEQSKEINKVPPPKVIIAGSGMSNGGRILHHEQRYLPDPNSTILFVGYQAAGTLGRRIMEGAKKVHIFGEEVRVHAQVKIISSYSAHADQPRILEWLGTMRPALKKVFTAHGEEDSATVLVQKIKSELGVDAEVPKMGQIVEL